MYRFKTVIYKDSYGKMEENYQADTFREVYEYIKNAYRSWEIISIERKEELMWLQERKD